MTVQDNVAFGLTVQTAEGGRGARAPELLALDRLEELAERYPSQLSGGQMQRIGARAGGRADGAAAG
jgi:ABC-type sulfate/molybdate transport systems ATPase subunit